MKLIVLGFYIFIPRSGFFQTFPYRLGIKDTRLQKRRKVMKKKRKMKKMKKMKQKWMKMGKA